MKTRKFLITINNPLDHGFDDETIKGLLISETTKYMCMCHEVGEQGTPHIHIFVIFDNPRDFKSIIKKFDNKAHIDNVFGTNQECLDYIKKEGKYLISDKKETNLPGTFFEYGEIPIDSKGKRNDNIIIQELIKDGNTPKEIIDGYPQYSLKLKQINMLYELYRWDYFKFHNRDNINTTFIYGETGTGKTSYVFNKHGFKNVYQVTDYKHPFDGYDGQDVILFDEFRNDIECKEMLKYLDRYPVQLPCRYNNKWACYTKVYIISNIKFEDIYSYLFNSEIETLKAFRRRVNDIITMKYDKLEYYSYNINYSISHKTKIKEIIKEGTVLND